MRANKWWLAVVILGFLWFWISFLFSTCCLAATNSPVEANKALQDLCFGHTTLLKVVTREATRYGISPTILVAVIRQESLCRPWVVGNRGEVGLMQIKPGTRADGGTAYTNLFKPAVNIHLGAAHLARCLDLCGDMAGALGVFSGIKTCAMGRKSKYAASVLALVSQVLVPVASALPSWVGATLATADF